MLDIDAMAALACSAGLIFFFWPHKTHAEYMTWGYMTLSIYLLLFVSLIRMF